MSEMQQGVLREIQTATTASQNVGAASFMTQIRGKTITKY